jgi:hypothetical protein
MPVSFKFVNNKTNEIETLANIDNLIANHVGKTPHEKYCYFMDPVAELGIWILMKSNGDHVTKESFDDFMNSKESAKDIPQIEMEAFRKFLYEDFTFHAWR